MRNGNESSSTHTSITVKIVNNWFASPLFSTTCTSQWLPCFLWCAVFQTSPWLNSAVLLHLWQHFLLANQYNVASLLDVEPVPKAIYVTESRKTVLHHTFLFHYIYYCNMNSITFSTSFHIFTWNLMLKLLKLCNKYSGNTYALVEI